jgi:hypothetical protein
MLKLQTGPARSRPASVQLLHYVPEKLVGLEFELSDELNSVDDSFSKNSKLTTNRVCDDTGDNNNNSHT